MKNLKIRYLFVLMFLGFGLIVHAQSPLRFVENLGQWEQNILFKAERKEGKVFVQKDRLTFLIFDSLNANYHMHDIRPANQEENYCVFSLMPLNARASFIETSDRFEGYYNYFIGRDKSRHKTHVLSYKTLTYKDVYDNIDWQIESDEDNIKHTFIVGPNADPTLIQLKYLGVEALRLQDGLIDIQTAYGDISENALYVYQIIDNQQVAIPAQYNIDKDIVSYQIGDYDKSRTLFIDPGLTFATYIGSHSDSWGMTSCYDHYGQMISGGIVHGNNYPITEGTYNTGYKGNWDCVISKYDSLGQSLIFSTFLGGSKAEMPHSMICNQNDEVLVFGTTGSDNYPVSDNAFQTQLLHGEGLTYENSIDYTSGADIFITCLSSNGDNLVASTLIGGNGIDGLNFKNYYGANNETLYDGNDSLYCNYGDISRGEIITDSLNNVYVASCTFSNNFPTTSSAYKTSFQGVQDAVVFKFDHSLSSLLYSTYLGGIGNDAAYSLDIDNQCRVYVCGGTVSSNFPTTPSAYNNTHNGGTTDAFVSLLSADGSTLVASTYFGSDKYDQAYFVRLNRANFPHIYGQTKAEGPTLVHNVGYAIPNSGQFVAKLSPELDSLHWSTVFGSGDGLINLSPSGFAVDVCNRVYCSGWGRIFKYQRETLGYPSLGTTNLQTTEDAYMSVTDGQDFYIIALDADATNLEYASFYGEVSSSNIYGADHVDGGTSRFDHYGNWYQTICASCGGSQGLPTSDNAYSPTNQSTNCNIASIKFSINNDFAVADFLTPSVGCRNTPINFINQSRGEQFLWDFGDGTTSTQSNPTHIYQYGGLYEVSLSTTLSAACRVNDTIKKNVLILADTSYALDTIYTCLQKPTQIGLDYFSTYICDSLTFRWYPGDLLSDSTIINPFASISSPTTFTLVIDNGYCKDTIYQHLELISLSDGLPDTLDYCSLPFDYYVPINEDIEITASLSLDFDSIISVENSNQVIINDTSRYLYLKLNDGSCASIDSIWLNFTGYDFDLHINNVSCNMDNNGSAEVISHTFPEPVTYSWSCSSLNTSSVQGLEQGTYTVTLSSSDGCMTTKTFDIGVSSNLLAEVEKQDNSCIGVNDGSIKLILSGGNSPYKILWSNDEQSMEITNLEAGIYSYEVEDASGCKVNGQVEIINQDSLVLNLTNTLNHCESGCSAEVKSFLTGGIAPINYQWSNGENTQNINDVCVGNYTLKVEDNRGCKANAQVYVGFEDALVDFSVSASQTHVYDGATITLEATNIDDFSYQWTPSLHLSSPFSPTTQATVYETTTYNIFVTDNKGCSKQDDILIEVEFVQCEPPNIFVPNVFTPNADGKNDIIQVSGQYIESVNFAIYDRWGEKVFQCNDIQSSWDGTFRGVNCQAGVYYYRIEVNCAGGKTYLSGGDITLIR